MLAIPADDLLRWNDITSKRLRDLLLANPRLNALYRGFDPRSAP
jgi:hypothetical protein